MRKADFDIEGPLVYKKRYSAYFSKSRMREEDKESKLKKKFNDDKISSQKLDFMVIGRVLRELGLYGRCNYASEWPDYIEDFDGPKTSKNTIRLQSVYFDHVFFVNDIVIIIESDDRSHYDENYCKMLGWDFQNIKRRDRIKDVWAQQTNTFLLRLPEHHIENGVIGKKFTADEKFEVLYKIIKNIRDAK